MKKKFICLALVAGLLLSALTGCSSSSESSSTDTTSSTTSSSNKTGTITLTAITGDSTTEDAIQQVQQAMNRLTKSEYKTQVILQLVKADEYVDYIDKTVAKIEEEQTAAEESEAAAKEEAKKKKEAEKAANANKKNRSKWITTTTAETEDTSADTEETTQDEYGREVVKYPDLEGTQLDIVFMTGIDMFNDFVEKGYLQSLNDELTNNSKILNKYIYPTFLSAGKSSGTTYAIANNRIMGEYTYLLIDKELADKYQFDATSVKTLADCEAFLDEVKTNEKDVVPMNEPVDLNYVQYCTGSPSVLGTVIKSTYSTSSKAVPKNLLTDDAYVAHQALLDKMEVGNYFGTGNRYAIQAVKGYINTPDEEKWSDNYYVVTYELPICSNEVMYSGMFGVSAYASDVSRCMEIITMLNTDSELRNIYQYGIKDVNYSLNDDGTVHMLNNDWSMNLYQTGNCFIAYVPEGNPTNLWEIGKLQNVETLTSPYFMWQYANKDTADLLQDYLDVSETYMTAFNAASDKVAYAASVKDEMAANETLKGMLDADNSNGMLSSYVDFFTTAYPSTAS